MKAERINLLVSLFITLKVHGSSPHSYSLEGESIYRVFRYVGEWYTFWNQWIQNWLGGLVTWKTPETIIKILNFAA